MSAQDKDTAMDLTVMAIMGQDEDEVQKWSERLKQILIA